MGQKQLLHLQNGNALVQLQMVINNMLLAPARQHHARLLKSRSLAPPTAGDAWSREANQEFFIISTRALVKRCWIHQCRGRKKSPAVALVFLTIGIPKPTKHQSRNQKFKNELATMSSMRH